ncbi:repressor protein [Virgibacillus sp. SK37]|nr:repressor protein [Virgibacillus sp. SK37]
MRWMRLKRGFTLSQVADGLGISTNYVSQLERGERKVTDDLVVSFAKLYNIDEDILFWKSGKIPLGVRKLIVNDKSLQEALSKLYKSRQ